MLTFAIAVVSSLVSLAAAQMTIQVGAEATTTGGIFQFIPPTLNATKGTVVTFEFSGSPGNHSVTQSTLNDPCDPMPGGFDSGWVFIPDANTLTGEIAPTFNITITDDSQPIWFFCKQLLPAPHCPAGMIGAINAPDIAFFNNFTQTARNFQGTPGQGQGGLVGQGASASALPGPLPSGVTLFTGVPIAASGSASPTAPGSASPTAPGSASPTAPGSGSGSATRSGASAGGATSGTSSSAAGTASSTSNDALALSRSTFTVALAALLGYIVA